MELEMKASGLGVLFHSDLLRGTPLSREIDRYSFFSYDVNEALLVSEKERNILLDCIDKIDYEMEYSIGLCGKSLITRNIKLFIDYCMRFYDRQFVTRSEVNHDVLVKFERLLDGYFKNADLRKSGLPQVRYFADKIYLSPNYFGDLIKKETGMTA